MGAETEIGCQICQETGLKTAAFADAKIPKLGGVWGYVCKGHFVTLGCQLGLGKGQEVNK